jgi:nucleoside 2-deoxyribosyltransferase
MYKKIECPVCGVYELYFPYNNNSLHYIVQDYLKKKNPHLLSLSKDNIDEKTSKGMALVKYYVKKYTNHLSPLQFENEMVNNILDNSHYPSPMEQVNYLITFLGDTLTRPGKKYDFDVEKPQSISMLNLISATTSIDPNILLQIIEYARELKFISEKDTALSLTIYGWQKYEKLKKNNSDSTTAFMAMAFSNNKLQNFYEKNIKKAVSETGYAIEKVNENPEKDENINVDIMLKIRSSKFVIVDLSDANNGAYWEAGYAKGLGKKVIYIFDKSVWDKQKNQENKKCVECGKECLPKPHFDVNRNRILHWDEGNPDKFCKELKNTIRFAFLEAKQTDS